MVRIRTVITLLSYTIALIGFAPLFAYLDTASRLLFPAAFAGSLLAERFGYQLRGIFSTVISLVFFIYYAAQFSTANLVGPAMNLLVALLAVRLLSEKSVRNYLQIFALSLFALAGSSLLSLDAIFLLYLLLLLFLIAVSLVILTFYETDHELSLPRSGLKRILAVALIMPAAALPLMLFFFIIMPRAQTPLWNFLNVAGGKSAGFSEKVQPGNAASIGEEKGVAFRATSVRLPKEELYWRGIVLNSFSDNAWIRKDPPPGETAYLDPGRAVQQTIFTESAAQRYLFALNVPRQVSGVRSGTSSDFVLTRRRTSVGRSRYEVISLPGATIRTRKGIDREFYLTLPLRISQRTLALGKEIGRRGESDVGRLRLLEDFYNNGRFIYATTTLPVGEEPLDQFLFDKKRGNCEFFAASLATLLRVAGVPSRLAGGYYGGEYNEVGGYYLVTEAMAHVWVEVYLAGKGWVTVDPSQWAVNSAGIRQAAPPGLFRRIGMSLDAFSYFWNMAVINYDLEKQVQLLSNANNRLKGLSFAGFLKKLPLFTGILLAVAMMIVLPRSWRRRSPEERLLRKFLRLTAARRGIAPDPATGILDLPTASRSRLCGNSRQFTQAPYIVTGGSAPPRYGDLHCCLGPSNAAPATKKLMGEDQAYRRPCGVK
jgi:transglutaminase-like putative cysteine protease